jgi:hypothetical protein
MMIGMDRDTMSGGMGGQAQGMMSQMRGMQSQMMGAMRGGGMMNIQPTGPQVTGAFSNQPNPATADESDPNLVEFGLYGIISLYDRPVASGKPDGTSPPAGQGSTPTPAPTTPPAATGATAPPAPPTPPAAQQEGQAKPGDQQKTDPAAKPQDQTKTDDKPKVDDKKTDNPAGSEPKKAGENKGN